MAICKKILVFIISILIISACATQKKQVEVYKIQKDSLIKTKEEKHQKIINQAINDTVFLSLPKSNNKEVDSLITSLFTNFKSYKKSGVSSYGITYNQQQQGFNITARIGATKNELLQKTDTIIKFKDRIVFQNREVVKYRIPLRFWVFYAVSIGAVYWLSRFKIF